MPRPAKVTRVSKATREKIIKAASRAFARNGYEGASIRAIVAEADVNQAAINYHFGSKEGLYRAVLQAALRALMKDDEAPQNNLAREAALRRFVRRQLRPMTARDELSEYVRIFNWETLKPSPVFRKFMAGRWRRSLPLLPSWLVDSYRAEPRTSRRSSVRCGCLGSAAFSFATPTSLRTLRCASRSTNASWTGLPIPSPPGPQRGSPGCRRGRGPRTRSVKRRRTANPSARTFFAAPSQRSVAPGRHFSLALSRLPFLFAPKLSQTHV